MDFLLQDCSIDVLFPVFGLEEISIVVEISDAGSDERRRLQDIVNSGREVLNYFLGVLCVPSASLLPVVVRVFGHLS